MAARCDANDYSERTVRLTPFYKLRNIFERLKVIYVRRCRHTRNLFGSIRKKPANK